MAGTGDTLTSGGSRRAHPGSGPEWVLGHLLEDNALRPSFAAGDRVWIDCSERGLEDGAVFAVRSDGTLAVRVFLSGLFGIGPRIGGRPIGFLCSLAGPLRLDGPFPREAIPVIGRVREAERIADLVAERARVLESLAWAQSALTRLRGRKGDTVPLPPDAAASVEACRTRLAAALADEGLRPLLAAELVVDALAARAGRLEGVIAATPAADLHELEAKLRVLWDLEYGPFPELQEEFAAHLLAGALEDLPRLRRNLSPSQHARAEEAEIRLVRSAVRAEGAD